MGRSTAYYRNNPEARRRKYKEDKKINARPKQKAKRRELEKRRVAARKKGIDTSKSDYDHATGRRVSKSKNRGRTGEGNRVTGKKHVPNNKRGRVKRRKKKK